MARFHLTAILEALKTKSFHEVAKEYGILNGQELAQKLRDRGVDLNALDRSEKRRKQTYKPRAVEPKKPEPVPRFSKEATPIGEPLPRSCMPRPWPTHTDFSPDDLDVRN